LHNKSVGTYLAWESTATLRLLGGARRGGEGRGILCRHAHSLLNDHLMRVFCLLPVLLPIQVQGALGHIEDRPIKQEA